MGLQGYKYVQERLGLSRSTVYELAASGQLPSVKIGVRRMFDPADVEAFIARHRQTCQ